MRNILGLAYKLLGSRDDCVMFRNNVGMAKMGKRFIKYGLSPGSSDLIGWKEKVVTQDMVGKKIAIFTAIEVKSKRKGSELKSIQCNFLTKVFKSGGYGGIARSTKDALRIILNPLSLIQHTGIEKEDFTLDNLDMEG